MKQGEENKSPFFSIVIPVYNRSGSLKKTIDSVLAQTFSDFECLIIDDGSTDAEKLKQYVSSLDDTRFQYIWRENGGGGAARNTGIVAAKGAFIAFLDSDDLFLPEKLQTYKNHVSADPMKALYSSMYVDRGVNKYWIRPDRAITAQEDMGEYLFVDNQFIQTSTIVLHTTTAKQVLFDPNLRKGQDLDFCLRLHQTGVRFQMIKAPLTVWVDTTEQGRTSRTSGHQAPLQWLQHSKSLLTQKAELGYRATVLFYYLAKQKPLTGLKDLFKGYFYAGVPAKVIVRQFLRGFLPRQLYRLLVNKLVNRSVKSAAISA